MSAAVYREAARRIAEREEEHSCIAITAAFRAETGIVCGASPYEAIFAPEKILQPSGLLDAAVALTVSLLVILKPATSE